MVDIFLTKLPFLRMKIISHLQKMPYFAAFIAGCLAGLAFAPFYAVPLLWLLFPFFYFLLTQASTPKKAFWLGWFFSFGHLIVCLHWIAASLFVEIELFWWALPLAICGIPALLAIFYGMASYISHRWGLSQPDGVFFFAASWFLADLARAHLFTGFPWDILGYVWSDDLSILQSVSLFGIEGLTGITIVLVMLPVLYLYPHHRKIAHTGCFLGIIAFVSLFLWGSHRLASAQKEWEADIMLRLVQPEQDQTMKWHPDQREKNLDHLLAVSFKNANPMVTHYIWPETAVPYYLSETPNARDYIARYIPKGTVVITGVVRRAMDTKGNLKNYFNSLIALNDRGDIIAGYDKHHLVPFGEYIPFHSLLPIRVITALGIDFKFGDGIRSLRVPHMPVFGPLVCYEAIFSGEVASRDDPPSLLINVTNDAWYEGTIGISQHFAMVKARAIEEGMPLVRVSNKGFTGIIDPWGEFQGITPNKTSAYIDVKLPKPLSNSSKSTLINLKIKFFILLIPFAIAIGLRVTGSKS